MDRGGYYQRGTYSASPHSFSSSPMFSGEASPVFSPSPMPLTSGSRERTRAYPLGSPALDDRCYYIDPQTEVAASPAPIFVEEPMPVVVREASPTHFAPVIVADPLEPPPIVVEEQPPRPLENVTIIVNPAGKGKKRRKKPDVRPLREPYSEVHTRGDGTKVITSYVADQSQIPYVMEQVKAKEKAEYDLVLEDYYRRYPQARAGSPRSSNKTSSPNSSPIYVADQPERVASPGMPGPASVPTSPPPGSSMDPGPAPPPPYALLRSNYDGHILRTTPERVILTQQPDAPDELPDPYMEFGVDNERQKTEPSVNTLCPTWRTPVELRPISGKSVVHVAAMNHDSMGRHSILATGEFKDFPKGESRRYVTLYPEPYRRPSLFTRHA